MDTLLNKISAAVSKKKAKSPEKTDVERNVSVKKIDGKYLLELRESCMCDGEYKSEKIEKICESFDEMRSVLDTFFSESEEKETE